MILLRRLFLAALVAGLPLFASMAAEQRTIERFRAWTLYEYDDGATRLCYIASEPSASDGNYARRGPPAVLVTRLPAEPDSDEVSVQPGYPYLSDSRVAVAVDGSEKFTMFTQGEYAWTDGRSADAALIAAMKRGREMTVRGTSQKNTWSEDTYSLLGFTAAYNALQRTCQP